MVLEVLDVRGRLVARPWSGAASGNEQGTTWDLTDRDGRRLPPGVYRLRLVVAGEARSATRSLVVLR